MKLTIVLGYLCWFDLHVNFAENISSSVTTPTGLSHHSTAPSQPCEDDVTYQPSTSGVSARWSIPVMLQPFVTNVLWAVEQEIFTYNGKAFLTYHGKAFLYLYSENTTPQKEFFFNHLKSKAFW